MWSITYKRCEICPASTFARSGDISCTRCPTYTFSNDGLPVCFPNNFVGAIIKLDQDFETSDNEQFQRSISSILNITTNDVFIIDSRPGSTIYYFYLNVIGFKLNPLRSQISGNELMLQFYELYQTNSPILKFSSLAPILSLNLVTVQDPMSSSQQGVSIQSQPSAIVPPV